MPDNKKKKVIDNSKGIGRAGRPAGTFKNIAARRAAIEAASKAAGVTRKGATGTGRIGSTGKSAEKGGSMEAVAAGTGNKPPVKGDPTLWQDIKKTGRKAAIKVINKIRGKKKGDYVESKGK